MHATVGYIGRETFLVNLTGKSRVGMRHQYLKVFSYKYLLVIVSNHYERYAFICLDLNPRNMRPEVETY